MAKDDTSEIGFLILFGVPIYAFLEAVVGSGTAFIGAIAGAVIFGFMNRD